MDGFAVVLTTFNGEGFLDAQLDSIAAQDAGPWRLYVRDDGSCDATADKLAQRAARDPRIALLPADGRNLGPAQSFGVLLQHALDRGERYVFLCDQDDVWLPGKCARLMSAMRQSEGEVGAGTPILVHADLRVVGPDLSEIHPSLARLQRMESRETRRSLSLLLRNSVTGCASLVNAPLLRCALPMPTVAMHDWWLAQCAAVFGSVSYIDEPTVLYRQHGANVVGARGLGARGIRILRSPFSWWTESTQRFLAGLGQLWILRARARDRDIPLSGPVGDALGVLWSEMGTTDGSLQSRVRAAMTSGALPDSGPLRVLAVARIALLPALRSRFGDERRRAV